MGKHDIELNFNGVVEFKRYLEKNSDKPSTRDILTRTGDWTGVDTWRDFQDYMLEGNKEITAEVKTHVKYYIDKFEDLFSEVSAYQFDVVGEFFDIGAVMVGEPEAWIKEIKVKDDKFIDLVIQGTYQDGTDLDMVRKNGSKVFAIAKVLESQGYLVRITMVYSSKNSNTRTRRSITTVNVKVKDYDQGLDFKKFGILLGVPMFRRGFLRVLEIVHGEDCSWSFGMANQVDDQINLDKTRQIDELEKKLQKDI